MKDSGQREQYASGMQRDTTEGKVDFSLALDGPMFVRYAEHLTKGAEKYEKRNWMKATGQAELDRFRESALRHFLQWYFGDVDEDHAAAVIFNINGAEYVKEQMPVTIQDVGVPGQVITFTPEVNGYPPCAGTELFGEWYERVMKGRM